MLDRNNFNIYNYVAKEEYVGSMDGMRYMIKRKKATEEGAKDKAEVIIWPEPYAYAYTDESLKIREFFDFTEEAMLDICDYLNEQYTAQLSLWELSKSKKTL